MSERVRVRETDRQTDRERERERECDINNSAVMTSPSGVHGSHTQKYLLVVALKYFFLSGNKDFISLS